MANIGGIGAVAGIGLEELVPHQDAVLVAQLVEVLAGALAHPVANQVEVGELVHADLGVEPLARDALQRLIEAPVAAADEDGHAVDGDGERVGAGNGVADFANAEADILRVGDAFAASRSSRCSLYRLLRAVAVRPPQARMIDVQRRRVCRVEGDLSACCAARASTALREDDVLDRAADDAC